MLVTEKTKNTVLLYVLTAAFLAVSFYFVFTKETYWFFLLPLILIVFYYYLVALDRVLLFIALLTPLAIKYTDPALGSALSVPSEPLMIGVVAVFLMNLILTGQYNRKISTHPFSYLIFFYLFWMVLTTLTSSLPLISVKHLLSKIWFIVPFFFVAIPLFKDKINIHRFLVLYSIGLAVVVMYTIIRHAHYGFDEDAGHWVMTPFYNDHTAYGAALALFLPVLGTYIFYPGLTWTKRLLALSGFVFFSVALLLSYSRAAWLSVFVAVGVLLAVLFKIKFRWIMLAVVVLAGSALLFQQQILDRMEKNKQDSSTNFEQHLQSMSNISSDASNLERLNRWSAAIRMFEAKPWVGWGPGTYQFVYAPFQLARERTIISTNLGDRGTAHSEYLGPLSEEGIPGMISILLLFGYAVYLGLRIYKHGNKEVRLLSLMVTLGLITYMTHGFLNNFLSTDKLAVPVWGYMAILVALDVYHLERKK